MKKFLLLMLLAPAALSAAADSGADASVVVRKDSAFVEKHRFQPTAKRIDRRIDRIKFAYKGEVALGITASYGTISSDDTDMMLILDHINLDGTMAQVNPFVGYFYRDNNMVGLRLGYRHIGMGLGNLEVDLGSQNDLDISLDNMDYSGNAYSFGLFHRSYTGIDPKGSFGLFAELELSGMIGRSDFSYLSGDTPKSTHSKSFKMNISFNPTSAEPSRSDWAASSIRRSTRPTRTAKPAAARRRKCVFGSTLPISTWV